MRVLKNPKLHFVLFQMNVEFGNSKENFKRVSDFLDKQNIRENSFLILPELFLTGYHKEEINAASFKKLFITF
ncbi:MAG: hypothetical protein HeimC2_08800 [Candidatus Heimdallarchaeota archaeon LC_2]|nr:MAG: hypothetical protein HeimC2_08780 [Candidatus Heimdallarchaeota archaeon LC_2]OLS28225.1 MAG: hypothetical protein HeimC2_08800 [Candidatus Heimdallarchaeota archaeon LC_2]